MTYRDRRGHLETVMIDMGKNGDVVVGTFRDSGAANAELVTRLPKGKLGGRDANLLMAENESQGNHRQILITPNNVPFKRHHALMSGDGGGEDFNSPFLLTREKTSIPAARFQFRGALSSRQDLAEEARKRICYSRARSRPD